MDDPRIARTRAAVLDAAADLLVEGGPAAVTMDAIVARSGVAKSTIYRHWPSRDEVLVDVFVHCAPQLDAPDPSLPLVDALEELTRSIVAHLRDPQWAHIVPALLMLKAHLAGVADLEERIHTTQNETMTAVLQRGIDQGALPRDLRIDDAIAHLAGPLLFAHLTGTVELDDDFARRTTRAFLVAYSTA
jgi:AcrR family transcriptional regulator